LKRAATGALGLSLPRIALAASTQSRPLGANDDVRIAVVGVGSKEAVGGVGGRGHQLIGSLQKVPGARIVALCDVDKNILDRQAAELKDQGQPVAAYGDLRRVFDSKEVDAVVVATPNHWHALATIWACQAGKDVYVEKPVSHNIWEGRQMVAAARKYGRIVQAGTQARSSSAMREAFDNEGKEIKKFGPIPWGDMDTGHMANFVDAVRSRKAAALHAEILEGHLSAACCHQVNISHRLGRTTAPGAVLERAKANPVLSDAVARYREHLRANEIDFATTEILGPWLTFDAKEERFTGEFAAEANPLLKRADRQPFVVPKIA
jgi:hypothetical protein